MLQKEKKNNNSTLHSPKGEVDLSSLPSPIQHACTPLYSTCIYTHRDISIRNENSQRQTLLEFRVINTSMIDTGTPVVEWDHLDSLDFGHHSHSQCSDCLNTVVSIIVSTE